MEAFSCEDLRDLLGAWMDGELSPAVSAAVARHVGACAACTRDLEGLRRIGDIVRDVVDRPRAPDALRARARAAIRDHARHREQGSPAAVAGSRWRRWSGLAAAGLAIAVASSTLTYTLVRRPAPAGAPALAAAAVERHVRALTSHHLIEVASADQHTVKPWFAGRVDFSPTVPRLDSLGFPLLGGRVDQLGGRAVAALVYGRRLHVIDVFTWPLPAASATLPTDTATYDERGFHALHWTRRDMEFWAVSDVALAELRGFAASFRRTASAGGEGTSSR